MKNSKILLLLLYFLSSNAFAQKNKVTFHQLQGVIINHYGFPVLNATITVTGNNKIYQANSDSNGHYFINIFSNGNFEIIVKAENYAKTMSEVFLIDEISDTEFIDFRLYGNLNKNINMLSCNSSCWVIAKPISPILKAPNQNINAIAAYFRGVDSRNGETPSIKGARPENTAYYIDGVRIAGLEENYSILAK